MQNKIKKNDLDVLIKDIHPEGIIVEGVLESDELGLTDKEYVQFSEPIAISVKLERVGNTILAKTKTKSRFKSSCAHCLAPIEGDWEKEFLLDFEVDPTVESIDLGEEIRQEIILNLPIRLQCDSDCENVKAKE